MTTDKSIGTRETELLERVRVAKGHSTDDWLRSPEGEAEVLMARVCDALEEALKFWGAAGINGLFYGDYERLRAVLREADGEP